MNFPSRRPFEIETGNVSASAAAEKCPEYFRKSPNYTPADCKPSECMWWHSKPLSGGHLIGLSWQIYENDCVLFPTEDIEMRPPSTNTVLESSPHLVEKSMKVYVIFTAIVSVAPSSSAGTASTRRRSSSGHRRLVGLQKLVQVLDSVTTTKKGNQEEGWYLTPFRKSKLRSGWVPTASSTRLFTLDGVPVMRPQMPEVRDVADSQAQTQSDSRSTSTTHELPPDDSSRTTMWTDAGLGADDTNLSDNILLEPYSVAGFANIQNLCKSTSIGYRAQSYVIPNADREKLTRIRSLLVPKSKQEPMYNNHVSSAHNLNSQTLTDET